MIGREFMANYIKDIRKKIGHKAIFVPCSGAIVYQDNKVLLQKRADNGKWSIHGGAVELGENYVQALERELQEEINVKPIHPELMGIYSGKDFYFEYPNGDKIYDSLCVFVVENWEGNFQKDNEEVMDLQWFNLENLPEQLDNEDGLILKDFKKFLQNKTVIVH